MITEFKIFENKDEEKYWFVDIFDLQFVESVYTKINKFKITAYFFITTTQDINKNIKDVMYIFIYTTKKIKNKVFPNWLHSSNNEKSEFDKNYDSINIEKWLKEYHIKQKAKKYNI